MNFDEKRAARSETEDRTFTIGGETFTARYAVRPEALFAYSNLTPETPPAETMRIIDELIVALIEHGVDAHDRWRALREREDDPVTLEDLTEVVAWLVQKHTGRPTEAPSPSTPGRNGTGTPSTDASSPAPAEASTTSPSDNS